MDHRIITIKEPDLQEHTIQVNPDSQFSIEDRNVYPNIWRTLILDGQCYCLAMSKRLGRHPERLDAINRVREQILAAITELNAPSKPEPKLTQDELITALKGLDACEASVQTTHDMEPRAFYDRCPAAWLVWVAVRAEVAPQVVTLALLEMIDTQLYEPCEHAGQLAAQLRAWAAGEGELPDLRRLAWPCRYRAHLELTREVISAQALLWTLSGAANAAHDLVTRIAGDSDLLALRLATIARKHLPYSLLTEALARHAGDR